MSAEQFICIGILASPAIALACYAINELFKDLEPDETEFDIESEIKELNDEENY